MNKIKWIKTDGTYTAKVPGGMLVRCGERGHGAISESMVFVPDARIALAGQISGGWITGAKVPNCDVIAEYALRIADEILEQAAGSEAGND